LPPGQLHSHEHAGQEAVAAVGGRAELDHADEVARDRVGRRHQAVQLPGQLDPGQGVAAQQHWRPRRQLGGVARRQLHPDLAPAEVDQLEDRRAQAGEAPLGELALADDAVEGRDQPAVLELGLDAPQLGLALLDPQPGGGRLVGLGVALRFGDDVVADLLSAARLALGEGGVLPRQGEGGVRGGLLLEQHRLLQPRHQLPPLHRVTELHEHLDHLAGAAEAELAVTRRDDVADQLDGLLDRTGLDRRQGHRHRHGAEARAAGSLGVAAAEQEQPEGQETRSEHEADSEQALHEGGIRAEGEGRCGPRRIAATRPLHASPASRHWLRCCCFSTVRTPQAMPVVSCPRLHRSRPVPEPAEPEGATAPEPIPDDGASDGRLLLPPAPGA